MCGWKLAVLAVCVYLVPARGQAPVRIDSSEIRAFLQNGATTVAVPVTADTTTEIRGILSLAWLDTEGVTQRSVQRNVTLVEGRSVFELPLPLSDASIWSRLRYSLTPDRASPLAFPPLQGIVAISEIAEHIFQLKIAEPWPVRRNASVLVRAQALQAVSREPAEGVRWKAELYAEDTRLEPVRVTPREGGFVEFAFPSPSIPAGEDQWEFEVNITASLGDFVQSESVTVLVWNRSSATIQTDKPLYQPGQAVHTRALVFDPEGHAAKGARVRLEVNDPEGETIHASLLTAGEFGVVQDDWSLLPDAVTGAYEITLTPEDDEYFRLADHRIRVSRYELPSFRVTAVPDRSAYLPGQNATIEIRGQYLFGKPVPNGAVRVVRMLDDEDDETIAEGRANAEGVYRAPLDLRSNLTDLDEDERFEDLRFAAYFTDPASGRTEQQRFDVRISRQPIHIYAVRTLSHVYVATYYADGRVAQADVEIVSGLRTVRTRTNAYGIGEVALPAGPESGREDLDIRATDSTGITGTWIHSDWLTRTPRVHLEADKTLHKAGEAVVLRLTASDPSGADRDSYFMVNALANGQLLASGVAHLSNGRAEISFPYQSEFRGAIEFIAWNGDDAGRYDRAHGRWVAVFPDKSPLSVTAIPEKNTYRPGEIAALHLSLQDGDGKPARGVLGVAIVDQAVFERARTDLDFGERSWFSCVYCNRSASVSGITLEDLTNLNPAQPIPQGLDLVAEMLMAGTGYQPVKGSAGLLEGQRKAFESHFSRQLEALRRSLDARYTATLDYPRDFEALQRILPLGERNRLDPWERPYVYEFRIENAEHVLDIVSSGPDQLRGTADDFSIGSVKRPYFLPVQRLIELALTSRGDYPASREEFESVLAESGLRFEALRDPWGTLYRADVWTFRDQRTIRIRSAGPDGAMETPDDVQVATFTGRYFVRERERIAGLLRDAAVPPQSTSDFANAMIASGIDLTQLLDAWGHSYRLIQQQESQFADRRTFSTVRVYNGPTTRRTAITPVTRTLLNFSLMSDGPDALADTSDDFAVATFPVLLREEAAPPPSNPADEAAVRQRGSAAIAGRVTDQTGAVIPAAKVSLLDETRVIGTAFADESGSYRFSELIAGTYAIQVEVSGFKAAHVIGIPGQEGATTTVDVTLEIGATAESIMVSDGALSLQTVSASMAANVAFAIGTPRIREYFPETLLWVPALETDANGVARLEVPLADSITTWKIAVIGSTENGQVAESTAEMLAFQPFFVDFDPPSQVTEGDQVTLPASVRNYGKRAENVTLNFQGGEAVRLERSTGRRLSVAADASSNASFSVHAAKPAASAPLRVTARAGKNRDDIERRITVRPDGQEVTRTYSDLVAGPVSFVVTVPENAVADATQGEIRLYPSVFATLLESARALMIAPHGCAEQTISAGFANLIALRYARAMGSPDPMIEREALANIRATLDALTRYRQYDGGIRYWENGDADVAVTAYGVRFLVEASAFVHADREALARSIDWLVKKQDRTGLWLAPPSRQAADGAPSLLLTSVVARSLAAAHRAGMVVPANALAAAYHHMAGLASEVEEPYALAQFALAAIDSDDDKLAEDAVAQLLRSGRDEGGALFWDLRTNTPFYGWGTPGRVETTATAVSALASWKAKTAEREDLGPAIRRGSVFLLRQRDRDGAWFSTQATVLVMEAIVNAAGENFTGKSGSIDVRVNGRLVETVRLPEEARFADVIRLEVSKLLGPGEHRVELIPSPGALATVIRMPVTHWVRWNATEPRQSSELRFRVDFDRTDVAAGEPIRCAVTAERVGFRGYGMLLAEVGLPPGADVDRASLQDALEAGEIDRYEVQPDRVVLYLWPKAAGSPWSFSCGPDSPWPRNPDPQRCMTTTIRKPCMRSFRLASAFEKYRSPDSSRHAPGWQAILAPGQPVIYA